MNAIAVIPKTKTVRIVDRPEPSIAAPDEIKLRILREGICGTDRQEAAGGRAKAPSAHDDLMLGHEMFGRVVDVGPAVTLVKPGDYAVFTVRRGCGQCRPCAMNRSDMCRTGLYAERGIRVWTATGRDSSSIASRSRYAWHQSWKRWACSPSRSPWRRKRSRKRCALAINGVYAITGIASGERPVQVSGAEFMRRPGLRNQVLEGSVNASHDHFQLAVNDLILAERRWPRRVAELITPRHPYADFEAACQHHGSDEIKVVMEWAA